MAPTETRAASALRAAVPAAVADIVRMCNPVRIILFGSVARGDDGPDSDLDFLVVLDSIDRAMKARLMGSIRAAMTAEHPIDVFVTDPVECERRRDILGSLHYWPLREGEVVYERPA